MGNSKDLAAITLKVHGLLKELTPDERQRTIAAVQTLFGDGHLAPYLGSSGEARASAARSTVKQSLASYLSGKLATTNQVRRFLATADWLRQRSDEPLSTAAVNKALKESHQGRLGNPSECLNQNAAKGFIEKDSKNKTFFITPEGLASLGHAID